MPCAVALRAERDLSESIDQRLARGSTRVDEVERRDLLSSSATMIKYETLLR